MDALNRLLIKELEVLELGSKIQSQVQSEVGKNQRDYFLREQMKAIQKELGEGDDQAKEIEELREKIDAAGMPDAVKKEALRELDRLAKMPVAAAEYTVSRTYLDWLVALPWTKRTDEVIDLARTKDDPRRGSLGPRKGQGPHPRVPRGAQAEPGGEGADPLLRRAAGRRQDLAGASRSPRRSAASSCASRSAACATRRRSAATAAPTSARCPARSSRACAAPSRRTRCSSSTRSTSSGADFRGDPASALLEVLDPEQNNTFRDHYLDVPFDLSEVLFITTANVLDPIPPALRDRMEVLELPGYTEEEKLEIAREHLVAEAGEEPRSRPPSTSSFTDAALRAVIRGYTREAGVRNLEREIGALCRKVARRRAEGRDEAVAVTPDVVVELLGRAAVPGRGGRGAHAASPAWRSAWPGRPPAATCCSSRRRGWPGAGTLTLTGQLGDVMKESARAALSWVRAHAARLGIEPDFFKTAEIHLHVPSGAIPKDGPSAGVTMVTALVSELTGRPVRGDLAMTGEITLSGRVLPVGGIKEKVLAARRAGLREVILPRQNEKNVNEDLSEDLRRDLRIHLVSDDRRGACAGAEPAAEGPAANPPRKPPRCQRPRPSARRR